MGDKIFLVEDDISICEMVSNYLVSEGFSVDIFHNGAAAVKAFQDSNGLRLPLSI